MLAGNIPELPPQLDIGSQTLVEGLKPFKIQNQITAILPCVLKKDFTNPILLKTEIISYLRKSFPNDYPKQLHFYRKLHKDNLAHWFDKLVQDNLSKVS